VDRCEDRETKWIFKHIIEEHKADGFLWFNLAIARFINWSPTLAKLGYFQYWQPKWFCKVMAERKASGEKVYTGAYMIRAGTGEDAKLEKHEYLVKRVFDPLWNKRPGLDGGGKTCRWWDEFFGSVFGMGDFMRNQIITDMKYSHHLPKKRTEDWTTFILAGPGTRRGLNRLRGKPLGEKIDDPTELLIKLRRLVNEHIKLTFDYPVFDDLNNLSNCCCEFDKYRRLVEGTGEPRSRYHPR
jgi:hypothetical protein